MSLNAGCPRNTTGHEWYPTMRALVLAIDRVFGSMPLEARIALAMHQSGRGRKAVLDARYFAGLENPPMSPIACYAHRIN